MVLDAACERIFSLLTESVEVAKWWGPRSRRACFATEERLALHRSGWTDSLEKLREVVESGPSRWSIGPLTRSAINTGSYVTMVEFSSYEEAMKNSEDPATSEFAEKMAALCDGPPVFHNFDIARVENRS